MTDLDDAMKRLNGVLQTTADVVQSVIDKYAPSKVLAPINTVHKPVVTLERNNAGKLYIGVTEFDDNGMGVRSYVLSQAFGEIPDRIMQRRYDDMLRLMGDNVRTSFEEESDDEADDSADSGQ